MSIAPVTDDAPALLPSRHQLTDARGTARACGRAYGEAHAEAMAGFLKAQFPPARRWLGYARDCWALLRGWHPGITEVVLGLAEGYNRPPEEVVLLLLHEEIGHAKACTAFGATGAATVDGAAIIGQNWDWDASLYSWPHLLRMRSDTLPATVTYAYPGLWASAGINEHGVSLVWTSSGIWPNLPPVAGIPTYALIAGVLACATAREAVALLRGAHNAGSFIFVIADAAAPVAWPSCCARMPAASTPIWPRPSSATTATRPAALSASTAIATAP